MCMHAGTTPPQTGNPQQTGQQQNPQQAQMLAAFMQQQRPAMPPGMLPGMPGFKPQVCAAPTPPPHTEVEGKNT